jgi:hypothetical protein
MDSVVDNLVLEHLKRFQASQDRIERKLDDMTGRLASLESGQVLLQKQYTHLAESIARLQLTSDGFNQRLERIERRLELV